MYTNNHTIRVILADDHEFIRQGFSSMILKEHSIELVAEAAGGNQLISLARQYLPDVILTDIKMPELDGIAATKQLAKALPQVAVIALTMFEDDHLLMGMLEAGAKGYLLKDVNQAMLTEAIKTVYNNGVYYSPAIRQKLQKLTEENRFDPVLVKRKSLLTRRETEILILICKEKTTKEMAAILHISERTIDHFRVNLMAKTGTTHVAGLMAYAVRHGLIQIN